MTVKEFIEELKKYPEDCEVKTHGFLFDVTLDEFVYTPDAKVIYIQ